jgi:hypothetical protein
MKTQSAKAKGRLLQQKVRDLILSSYEWLTEDDVRSTGMGQPGVDVQLSTAAKSVFPYDVECKNMASIAIYKWYNQREQKDGSETLLVVKANRQKPLAIIDLDHFIELQRNANDHKRRRV